ncbi:hypothetical protein [Haladaptatus halobius]|uniref:hypothetical protein n=1 Tax=Haladaptatus halobius TaxID=2884875 RepID=UPI001D0B01CD|nr:hypothetical protein [Haladaptatus halobius]
MPDTLITRIRDLRDAQPTQYGLLSAHHQEVQQALEACQRNYPCMSQLYETLDEPNLDRRMLGNILSLLVQFDKITLAKLLLRFDNSRLKDQPKAESDA